MAESTREKVLKKAIGMGYKQFSYMNDAVGQARESLPPGGGTGGDSPADQWIPRKLRIYIGNAEPVPGGVFPKGLCLYHALDPGGGRRGPAPAAFF
nr:hypothetical protein [uncultured Acetatifactor sp.]